MQRLLNKRERLILYLTVGIIIFAAGFNFILAPVLNKNDNLNKQISFVRTKLKKYLWLKSQKEQIQKRYSEFSSNLKTYSQEEDSLVGALSELEGLAKKANIRIIDLRPESTARNLTVYKEILIDLRAEGTMEGYLNFIYHLENSLSLLRIRRLQLAAKPVTQLLEGDFSISQLAVSDE